jgi:OHCU decarboxylase
MTLVELNACDLTGFIEAVGWVFERSPWVAERAWKHGPFASLNQLHSVMVAEVAAATPDEQLALLAAHPDLGTRAKMTAWSTREQSGAGLNQLTLSELEHLQQLNAAYRQKFGFPFLYAVKGSTKHDVLAALQQRILAAPEAERAEALRQVGRIARFRLKEAFLSNW